MSIYMICLPLLCFIRDFALKVDCLDSVSLAGLGGVFIMPLAGLAMVF